MSTENKYARTLAATKTESILAVIAGLPVDANGYFLTEEQMTSVESLLQANETAIAAHETVVAAHATEVAALNTKLEDQALQAQQAVAELATANATIAEKETVITGLNAKVTELENATPPPDSTRTDADKTGDTKIASWADPKNPANAGADKFFGIRKPAATS